MSVSPFIASSSLSLPWNFLPAIQCWFSLIRSKVYLTVKYPVRNSLWLPSTADPSLIPWWSPQILAISRQSTENKDIGDLHEIASYIAPLCTSREFGPNLLALDSLDSVGPNSVVPSVEAMPEGNRAGWWLTRECQRFVWEQLFQYLAISTCIWLFWQANCASHPTHSWEAKLSSHLCFPETLNGSASDPWSL